MGVVANNNAMIAVPIKFALRLMPQTRLKLPRLRADGVAIVGMTAMPEACLAAELGVPYVSISLVVNRAAGRGIIELDAIHQAGRDGMAQIQTLLRDLLEEGELLLQ